MRKAFLENATDNCLTCDQLLSLFDSVNESDFKLLIKIKSNGTNRFTYQEFCKWLGSAIHMSEGFYFRHDSALNPQQLNFINSRQMQPLKIDFTTDELEDLFWTKIQ